MNTCLSAHGYVYGGLGCHGGPRRGKNNTIDRLYIYIKMLQVVWKHLVHPTLRREKF
jgi:hypothetical protein